MTPVSLPFRRLAAIVAGTLTIACGGTEAADTAEATPLPLSAREFDGAAAMGYVRRQMAFGPRVPGTAAHRATGDWLVAELRSRADTVIVQAWTHTTADGQRLPMRNILARINPTATRRVLYLAHWDSRPIAEKAVDAVAQTQPTPGANDGASGVAILLGVADALKRQPATVGVDLLFVDGEDWGDFDTLTDVLIGSRYFVANLPAGFAPEFGVLFDMVGKADAQFLYETYSMRAAPDVIQRVWSTAQRLGYGAYFPTREYQPITDDHLPFIEKGFKVIDVIDLNYAYHHTPQDTEDKVSQETLQAVGDVAVAVLRGL
ncbi:M28 family peptidase [Pseudogemmatithrix spongiicola]|uniref:M28 family peptidase n=1 Tax=Pseudogemmatithrix spongiicola TaxID=3062599 RepID=A0AA49K1I6_9BACT|nr:M28 family peptidase [Gemmatimonadaceae bacterium 'strain 138']WKW15976.1 M28 family peptidase [Gemmatimonadaceae bacterium 'strain 318']